MAETKKSPEFLKKMALMTDELEGMFNGKATFILQLKDYEFRKTVLEFEDVPDPEKKEFKIEISGTDFIFLLDE